MGTNTPNLGLYKPTVGETGWGTLVNANADTLDALPLTTSASTYDTVAEYLLPGGGDCESTTGFVKVNANNPSLSSSQKTQGTYAVNMNLLKVGWEVNSAFTTKYYLNLTGDVARGEYLHLAIDFRWTSPDFDEHQFDGLCEFVVADAVDLGGNTVTWPTPAALDATWVTARIPINTLTKVRSVGIRPIRHHDEPTAAVNVTVDNIRFSAQTALEHALGANTAVVIPVDYDGSGQPFLPLGPESVMLDLRPDFIRVRGERDVREFQIPLDGVTDVTDDIQEIYARLRDGDKLVFPSGYRFLVSAGMTISNLTNVEIDYGGSKIYTQQSVVDTSLIDIHDCRDLKVGNVRLYGYSPKTNTATSMTSYAGSPNFVGDGTVQLIAQGDAVKLQVQNHGYTVDDEIPFDITVRQSGASVRDLGIEIISSDSPTTAVTATAAGQDEGGLEAGTYYYAVTYSDIDGRETSIGPRTKITLTSGDAVNLTNIPVVLDGGLPMVQIRGRNIYRTPSGTLADDSRNFGLVRQIPDNTTTTFYDNASSKATTYGPDQTPTSALGSAGAIEPGNYYYRYTAVNSAGLESNASSPSTVRTVSSPSRINVTVPVTTGAGTVAERKIYRTKKNPSAISHQAFFYYVGRVSGNASEVFEDNVPDSSLTENPPADRPVDGDIPGFAMDAVKVTPGAQDGVVRFIWRPVEQRANPWLIARKVSADSNTITISQCAMTTYAQFDVAAETSAGVAINGISKNIEVHDVFATLMGEDAVVINNPEVRGVTMRRIMSYGNRRQGIAASSGHEITIEDCEIHHPGRSGIDIEPYSPTAFTTNVTVRRVRIFNPKNYAIAAANWHKIRGFYVDDVYVYASGSLGWGGGGTVGRYSNVTCWWGGGALLGQNISMENCRFDSLHITASTKTPPGTGYTFTCGGHRVSNVFLLEDDFVDDAVNNIIESIYLVSGPGGGTPTITDITPP